MFLGKNVLKICSKFTGEHQYQSVISIKLIALRYGCSPVNLQHISEHLFIRTPLEGCFCCMLGNFLNVIKNGIIRSDNMGRSVLRVSRIYSKWWPHFSTTFFSSVAYFFQPTKAIFSASRVLLVKLALIVFRNFLLLVTLFKLIL